MRPNNERLLASSFVFVDTLIILFCFTFAHRVYLGNFDFTPESLLVLIFTVAASCLVLIGAGVYAPDREVLQQKEIERLVWGWTAVVFSVGLFVFVTRITPHVSRVWVGSSALLTLNGLISFRIAMRQVVRWSRKRGLNIRGVAVVGVNQKSFELVKYLSDTPSHGLSVKALFHIEPITATLRAEALQTGVSNVSPVQQLLEFIESRRNAEDPLDQVWINLPPASAGIMEDINKHLEDSSVDVYFMPDRFTRMIMEGESADYGDFSLVNISRVRKAPTAEIIKRCFDFVFAALVLLLVSPLLILIAIAIRWDSPGPVIFRQRRYGLDGQVIWVWKFRTMKVLEDGDVVRQAHKNDPRVTRVGAFLRATSLDEVPQFINVLQGRMSVVGPRPHPIAHNAEFRSKVAGYMMRYKFKPGITGWAQVNGWRGETDTLDKMEKRVEFDLQYIRNWSLWFDMKIIMMTFFKGFTGKNAY